jgi:hypothetical protein
MEMQRVVFIRARERRVYPVNYTLGWKQTRTKLNNAGRASRAMPPNGVITNKQPAPNNLPAKYFSLNLLSGLASN